MKMNSIQSMRAQQFWIWPSVAMVLYAVVNLCCVFMPFIPGLGAFFGFGILAPICFAIFHGTWIYGKREAGRGWKLWAFTGAFFYLALGVFTFRFISLLWASV